VIVVATENGTLQEFIKKPIDYVDGLMKSIQLYNQWQTLKNQPTLFS
jgi:hypothetical protein